MPAPLDDPTDIRDFFAGLEAAHAREDMDGYLEHFARDTVWVTSRGVCYRGRDALGDYLRSVIPGGLGEALRFVVESVHVISPDIRIVVVQQTYVDGEGDRRDARASHELATLIPTSSVAGRTDYGLRPVRTPFECSPMKLMVKEAHVDRQAVVRRHRRSSGRGSRHC